jgi:hypothetical protein
MKLLRVEHRELCVGPFRFGSHTYDTVRDSWDEEEFYPGWAEDFRELIYDWVPSDPTKHFFCAVPVNANIFFDWFSAACLEKLKEWGFVVREVEVPDEDCVAGLSGKQVFFLRNRIKLLRETTDPKEVYEWTR